MASFASRVKELLGSDYTIAKRNGSVEHRYPYFYRPSTLEVWKARLECDLHEAGISATVTVRDHWHSDPRKSYFIAIIVEE